MKEREFLHDLMNFITIIDGNIRRAERIITSPDTTIDQKAQESLVKANNALLRMIDKVKERREFLISAEEKQGKES